MYTFADVEKSPLIDWESSDDWIDKFLAYHCTGMDDHGNGLDDGCAKCDMMRVQLQWFANEVLKQKEPWAKTE